MTTELTFKDIGDKEIVDGDTVKDTSIKTNATPATFVFVLVIMSREDPCFQNEDLQQLVLSSCCH